MGLKAKLFYAAVCDKCDRTNNEDEYEYWSDQETPIDNAIDYFWWKNIDGELWCEDCFTKYSVECPECQSLYVKKCEDCGYEDQVDEEAGTTHVRLRYRDQSVSRLV